MSADQFRSFSHEFSEYLSGISGAVGDVRLQISEIMLAQGFQDLTGQIIQRVTTLVKDVEDNLIGIIRLATGSEIEKGNAVPAKNDGNKLEGPQIPGRETDTALSGQDEVDDLLSSLGF